MADNFHIDIKAFLHGYKPALLFNPVEIPRHYQKQDVGKLKDYPHIDGIALDQSEQTLYFQNDIGKRTFQSQTQELEHHSIAFQKELGLAIGFPPQAVDFYVEWMGNKEELATQIVWVHYSGIRFIAGMEHVFDDVNWLWNKYPYPFFTEKPVEIRYSQQGQETVYYIDFQDEIELKRVYNQLNQMVKGR